MGWHYSRYPHLPTCRGGTVSLISKVWDVLHYPVVDFRERQPFVGRRENGLRYELRVREVSPSVSHLLGFGLGRQREGGL